MKKYMLSVMDLVPSAFHHELKLTSAYPVIMVSTVYPCASDKRSSSGNGNGARSLLSYLRKIV